MSSTVSEKVTNPSFSESIRAATWSAHGSAEGSTFMKDLIAGRAPREQYIEFLAQQYLVYRELEQAGETMRSDPVAGPFVRDELLRVPAMEADLKYFLGDSWESALEPGAATRAYCDRIREVGASWPGGFVAHHYVRYMGDLSGGQFIARGVQQAYGVTPEAGASFYAFTDITDLDAFKKAYRARLDSWPEDSTDRGRIIEEILLAYRFNTDLAAQID